jgi:hypothetical protein
MVDIKPALFGALRRVIFDGKIGPAKATWFDQAVFELAVIRSSLLRSSRRLWLPTRVRYRGARANVQLPAIQRWEDDGHIIV